MAAVSRRGNRSFDDRNEIESAAGTARILGELQETLPRR